jgi:hypothetical protein
MPCPVVPTRSCAVQYKIMKGHDYKESYAAEGRVMGQRYNE